MTGITVRTEVDEGTVLETVGGYRLSVEFDIQLSQ